MNEIGLRQILFGRLNRLELPGWLDRRVNEMARNLNPFSFAVRPHIKSRESQLGISGAELERGRGESTTATEA